MYVGLVSIQSEHSEHAVMPAVKRDTLIHKCLPRFERGQRAVSNTEICFKMSGWTAGLFFYDNHFTSGINCGSVQTLTCPDAMSR